MNPSAAARLAPAAPAVAAAPRADADAWRAHAGFVAWPTVLLFASIVAGEVAIWAGVLAGSLPVPAAMATATVLAYASFTVMHDASHSSIDGGNPRLAAVEEAMGWIAGVPIWAPYPTFRLMHLRHHAHTNDPERDPDHWVVDSSPLRVVLRCLTLMPHYYADFLFGPVAKTEGGKRARPATYLGVGAMTALLVGLLAAGLGWEAVLLWLVPGWLATGLLAFAFDWLPHHPHSLQERYRDTRVLLAPGLTPLLLGQNYHLVHHLHPRVPFYGYAACFRDIRPTLEAHDAPIEGWRDALPRPFATELRTPADGRFEVTVAAVERTTADSVTLTLACATPLDFVAGQFLTLLLTIDGQELRRCYSLCTAPGEAPAITIKRVAGGRASNWLNDRADVGMRLIALPASGRFVFAPQDAPEHLVLIGGGSGLTPLLSMLRTAVRDAPGTRVTLLLGNRDAGSVLFRDALDALVAEHPGRVAVRHVLEAAPEGWTGGIGRLSGDVLAAELDALDVGDDARFGLCGPGPMMERAKALLLDRGVARGRITEERFVPAAPPAPTVALDPQPVTYRIGGVDHPVVVQPGQTFLQAALAHDVPVAWSCGGGSCGSCLMKLQSGAVDQPAADALLDRERDDGWFLGCCARPTEPCVVQQR